MIAIPGGPPCKPKTKGMNINDYTLLELYQLREYVEKEIMMPITDDDIGLVEAWHRRNDPPQALLNDINKRIEHLYRA